MLNLQVTALHSIMSEKLERKESPLDKLRNKLTSRGVNSIRQFGRFFRRIDDNYDCQIDFNEFKKAVREVGLHLEPKEFKDLFAAFDQDGRQSILDNIHVYLTLKGHKKT